MFSRIRNLTFIKNGRFIHFYDTTNRFRNELRIFNNINNKGLIYHNIPYGCTNLHMKIFNETKILNNYVNVVYTGEYTGRSPKDKYFVYNEGSESCKLIDWGSVNQKMNPDVFDELYNNVTTYLSNNERLYIFDGLLGRDVEGFNAKRIRVITPYAYQHHFLKNMVTQLKTSDKRPIDFTILNGCDVKNKNFKKHGLNSETFISFNIEKKCAIIGGTKYTGEMKKGLFTFAHYWAPKYNMLSIHASAVETNNGNVALISGLSGTGKTSFSSIIGNMVADDEVVWDDNGIWNLEGGNYAKTIRLSPIDEPTIYNAIRDNALLENVKIIKDKEGNNIVDYDDNSITENGRVSYPLNYNDSYNKTGVAKHPNKIIFLSYDAYAILDPVSILTKEQAKLWFELGYTSKVAGTERGIKEPTPTFSSCFGSAFLTRPKKIYSNLLMEKIKKHNCEVYLVNTGCLGAKGGSRMIIGNTKKIINSIMNDDIKKSPTVINGLGLRVPTQIYDIDEKYLLQKNNWKSIEDYEKGLNEFKDIIKNEISKNN
jgi:phosphoenolpyruvate carboxykinase (ATP)